MSLRAHLAARVSGRDAVPWSFVAPIALVLVASPLLLDASARSSSRALALWLVAAAAGSVVLCGVLFVADRLVFRAGTHRAIPLWWVSIAGGLAGVGRTLAMLATASLLGLDVGEAPVARIVAGLTFGALLAPAVAALAHSLREFRRRRRASIERLVSLRADAAGRGDLADALVDAAYSEVVVVMDQIRDDLDDDGRDLTMVERQELADRLRMTVTGSLRPLSHRLHATRDAPIPDARLSATLRGAFGEQPLHPGLSATFAAALFGPVIYARSVDLAQATAWALAAGLAIWATLALVRQRAEAHPALRRHTLSAGLGAALVAVALSTAAVDAAFGVDSAMRPMAAMAFTAVVIVAVSSAAAVMQGSRQAVQALEEQVDARTVDAVVANRELVRVSRELAQFMHGTLQSHLLATAFALESSASGVTSSEVLARARLVLQATAEPACPLEAIDDEMHRHAGLWEGFMHVTVEIDEDLPGLSTACVAAAGRVVEEALGNAHKHGAATSVMIEVTVAADDLVRIVVSDDGSGLRAIRGGLGSAWLDVVAHDAWLLEPGHGGRGARLQVDLLNMPGEPPGTDAGNRTLVV